eukprot:3999489-Prymnesium_polylepis.1
MRPASRITGLPSHACDAGLISRSSPQSRLRWCSDWRVRVHHTKPYTGSFRSSSFTEFHVRASSVTMKALIEAPSQPTDRALIAPHSE